jgi:hypothetical protein
MDDLSVLRWKYEQCKRLVRRLRITIATQESTIATRESTIATRESTIASLKSTIATLKSIIATQGDNAQKVLAHFMDERRRLRMDFEAKLVDVEAMLVEERRLREAAEEKIKELAAQIEAIKLECKYKVQSKLDVSKNQVGIPTRIPSHSSSPESFNDVEPSVCDRTMMIHTLRCIQNAAQRIIRSNPKLADSLQKDAKGMFKRGQIKVCLNDPASGHRMDTVAIALLNSWVRSENIHVVDSDDLLSAAENMSKIMTLLALCGLMAIVLTGKNDLSPQIIADVVAGHNQLVDFDRSSGSTSIDDDKLFARNLIGEALEKRSAFWVEGKDGEVVLFELIEEKNLGVDYVSDDDISVLVKKYPKNLRSLYGMEDSHKAMIVYDRLGNKCVVFTCMQIASAMASPANVHRLGNCAILFFHEWIRGFLEIAGAKNHHPIFPPFTTAKESILHQLLTKDGSTKVTALLHEHKILPIEVEYLCPGEVAFKWKKHSKATKAKMSEVKKGKKGKKHSKATKAKIGQSRKGKKHSKATKAKIGQGKKGKKHSKATKAKMSQSHIERHAKGRQTLSREDESGSRAKKMCT